MATTDTTLSQSFVYLVSPRGGNNYWAVVINGCDKLYDPNLGTLAIFLSPNGRYTLVCDPNFFATKSDAMKKLILVHEAAHIALRHPERLSKLLSGVTDPESRQAILAVYNIAADFAVNDSIVRIEKEFDQMMAEGQFEGLLPEKFGFPTGKTMEEYMRLLVDQRKKIKKMLDTMLGDGGEEGEESDGGEEGDEGDDGEGGDTTSQKSASGGKKNKKGKQGKGKEGSDQSDAEEAIAEAVRHGIAEAIATSAQVDPDYYEKLKEAFDQHAKNTHKQWNEKVNELTPEEGISLANKLKRHARSLVKSAHEQFKARGRGFLPSSVEALIASLLAEEQTPWTWIFNDILASAVSPKVIEEMASPNLMLINDLNVEPWPGFALDHEFHIIWITDTSGSMHDREYARACLELNGLLKHNKSIRVTYMECDAAMQKEMLVDNIQPPDEAEMSKVRTRKGYGGTVYGPAFRRILGLDTPRDWANPANRPAEPTRRPDLVVVVSDSGVVIEGEVLPQYHPGCPILWLLTPGAEPVPGMSNVPPDHVVQMFDMKIED